MKDIVMKRDLPRLISNIIFDTYHPNPRNYVFIVDYTQQADEYRTSVIDVIKHHKFEIIHNSLSQFKIKMKYGTTFRFFAPNEHTINYIRGLHITEAFVDLTTEHKEEHKEFLQCVRICELPRGQENNQSRTFHNNCLRPFQRLRQKWKNTMESICGS